MRTSTTRIAAGLLVSAALGLGSVAAGMTVASAASDPCPIPGSAGWDLAFGDVCQVVVPADATITVPADVTKLEAVLVGAGGGNSYDGVDNSAAGGGGEVVPAKYPGLPNSTPFALDIEVGAGSAYGDGGATSIDDGSGWNHTALGGGVGTSFFLDGDWYSLGGSSGNGNAGATQLMNAGDAAGGGARGDAAGSASGPGYASFAELTADFSGILDLELWPDTPESNNVLAAGVGFGGTTDTGIHHGNGSGEASYVTYPSQGGSSGVVILRIKGIPAPPAAPAITLSASKVEQHGRVTVTVTGLDPNETQLSAAVHSKPFPLGAATANGAGVATWVFNVPGNFPAGHHTVIVTRGAHGGQQLSLPLEVVQALANTGGPDTALLRGAAGMLGLSGLTLLTLRRRTA